MSKPDALDTQFGAHRWCRARDRRTVAEAFADEEDFVCLTDVRDSEGAEQASRCCPIAREIQLDVRLGTDWMAAVDAILKSSGRLDVLVNNAGITGFEHRADRHDPEHGSLEDW